LLPFLEKCTQNASSNTCHHCHNFQQEFYSICGISIASVCVGCRENLILVPLFFRQALDAPIIVSHVVCLSAATAIRKIFPLLALSAKQKSQTSTSRMTPFSTNFCHLVVCAVFAHVVNVVNVLPSLRLSVASKNCLGYLQMRQAATLVVQSCN
jgi:uncharacterized membrane protein